MEQRRKILIVDDERFNINVLADLLKPNYKIMAAISGAIFMKFGLAPTILIIRSIVVTVPSKPA